MVIGDGCDGGRRSDSYGALVDGFDGVGGDDGGFLDLEDGGVVGGCSGEGSRLGPLLVFGRVDGILVDDLCAGC